MKNHLIYAIGDVHGCAKTLDLLWREIEKHMNAHLAEKRTIVFLGDYVDRGPNSAGVIHRVLELTKLAAPFNVEVVALKGNHEDMMLAWINNPLSSGAGSFYLNGGAYTLASYEDGENIPGEHVKFLRSLKLYHQIGRFVFVHAGLEPLVDLEHQTQYTMLWERKYNYYNGPFDEEEKMFVVHGHTPLDEVDEHKHQVNIDTGCVFGGKLTCIVIDAEQDDNEFEYLQVRKAD